MEQFRALAEDAVKAKRITPAERREILAAYETACAATPTSATVNPEGPVAVKTGRRLGA